MIYEDIIQNIRNEMLKVNKALEQGKMATLNTEIIIAHIKGNDSVRGELEALDTVAKYYLNMMDMIDKSGIKINEYLHMIDELKVERDKIIEGKN